MMQLTKVQDLKRLRRYVLNSQGLYQAQPFGRGKPGALKAITHLGYVQIDSISVVERAHHHTLYSRVPGYQPEMLNELLNQRDIFEHWSHAAAFLPMDEYRFSLPYKKAIQNGQIHWFKNPDRKLMSQLLDRIRVDGALRSRDLESHSSNAGWWDWKPAKKALEQLYMEGQLMVSDRTGFQKTYDLTERVLPSHVDTQVPSYEEYALYLLNQQLRCNGVVSLKGITYLRKGNELKQTVKDLVNDKLSMGELDRIQVKSGEEFIIPAGLLDEPLPRQRKCMRILSPFDNLAIQRERLKAVFNFDYQLECYVPADKRKFGYFSLPLLYGDEFIGRMDCKVNRKDQHLEVKALHFEHPNVEGSEVLKAFQNTVNHFLIFQKCDTVSFSAVYPEKLTKVINDLSF